jgi:hypothetical protein
LKSAIRIPGMDPASTTPTNGSAINRMIPISPQIAHSNTNARLTTMDRAEATSISKTAQTAPTTITVIHGGMALANTGRESRIAQCLLP